MDAVNEWRRCRVTGRRVVIAAGREERPGAAGMRPTFETLERCPFCGGNEADTPVTIVQRSMEALNPWDVRVVANRYPAVTDSTLGGRGAHEVVIESSSHVAAFHELPLRQIELALIMWRERLAALRRAGFAYAWAFKNSGPLAGASLEHVHSQVVGLDFTPEDVEQEWRRSIRHMKQRGAAFAAAVIQRERVERLRVIAESDHFIALAPFVSRVGYEMVVSPLDPAPVFEACDRIRELAAMLRNLLASLARAAGAPDYNLVLQQAPLDVLDPAMRWRLEVIPRVTREAGFEWATGCHINAVPPERAAAELRANLG